MKRQRGRSRRNNNQHNANRSMESNGPDVKVRGTAKQIFDKYEGLARDAASSSNRVKAENYRQHAEHYLRIVNAIEAAKEKTRLEAEAAKAEAGENFGDGNSSDGKDEGRSRRRYPPQVRKNAEGETVSTEASANDTDSDDAESVETDEKKEVEAKAKKSTRRRKAPSRKSPDNEESTTEAAE